jgi:hypothetical protein
MKVNYAIPDDNRNNKRIFLLFLAQIIVQE